MTSCNDPEIVSNDDYTVAEPVESISESIENKDTNKNESKDENAQNDEKTDNSDNQESKIKNDGALDDGREWGPLED